MEKIREETNETILLGQRQDDHIVYLHVLESSQMIRYAAPIGALKPLPSTQSVSVSGELSDDELAAYLSESILSRLLRRRSSIVNSFLPTCSAPVSAVTLSRGAKTSRT